MTIILPGVGTYIPDGTFHTYRWGWAPAGLATRRQLASLGRRPGGQEPAARIVWGRRRRVAYLYAIEKSKPKRRPTTAQIASLARALAARQWCPTCQRNVGMCIPRRYGQCEECQWKSENAA
jgi:hypothetical protein